MLVVFGRFVEPAQPLFEARPRNRQIGAVGPDGNGLSVGIDRGRKVFQRSLRPRQNHGPAIVAWRLLNRLCVKIEQLAGALIPLPVESRFRRKPFVFWKIVEHFDELIHAAGIIL